MARNRLVEDVRKITLNVRVELAKLGHVGESVDDADLRRVEGHLADAVLFLNGAANRFERRGLDYPKPWFGETSKRENTGETCSSK